jgi:hypothetical protein
MTPLAMAHSNFLKPGKVAVNTGATLLRRVQKTGLRKDLRLLNRYKN